MIDIIVTDMVTEIPTTDIIQDTDQVMDLDTFTILILFRLLFIIDFNK